MGLFRARPKVIDLRDPQPARPTTGAAARNRFGLPTRCPSCHGRSRLDSIDLVRRTMAQTCTECGLRFDTSEIDLAAAATAPSR